MKWITLTEDRQLDEIIEKSKSQHVVIYKHSVTCPVNADAKHRLEEAAAPPDNILFYYLDLLAYRPLSNQIASSFDITHKSPQVLLIKDGKCIYTESHNRIEMEDIVKHAAGE